MSDSPAVHLAAVRGAELAWTEEGAGPAVVWAHGLTSTGRGQEDAGMFDWSPVARAGFRLVRYDARGHGASTGTRDPGDYTWASLGDDLLALLDQVAPGQQVAGMGSSMGTATLLFAALKEPDRFSRLVLTSAPTAWETRRAQADVYLQLADLVEAQGLEALVRAMAGAPRPAIFEELAEEAPHIAEDLLPTVFRGAARSDLPSLDEIATIQAPVLLLPWAGDPGHPVATSEALARVLPHAELELGSSLAETRAWGGRAAEFLVG